MTHGPIYTDKRAIEVILRWCDCSGEEPEGCCLYEIEQICRKQLGLQPLILANDISQSDPAREVEAGTKDHAGKPKHDWCADPNCKTCNRRHAAEKQSYDDLAASGGIVDAP